MEKEISNLLFNYDLLFNDNSLRIWKKLCILDIVFGFMLFILYDQNFGLSLILIGIVLSLIRHAFVSHLERALYNCISRLVLTYNVDENMLLDYFNGKVDSELFIIYASVRQSIIEEI